MPRSPGDLLRAALLLGTRRRLPHVHVFSRQGDDPFSGSSLYVCRCGAVRPGM